MKRTLPAYCCLLLFLIAFSTAGFAQVKWVADASSAEIPDATPAGSINGAPFSFKYGRFQHSGGLEHGSKELSFDHYTIELRDDEKFWLAKFTVDLTVTVKKGELPDGKTFRRVPKGVLDETQPSWSGEGFRVPQFPSLGMKGPSDFGEIGRTLSDSAELYFSGVVTFGRRNNGKIPVAMYVCFHDELKSCVAGRAEVEIIVKEETK